jgi:hypothetical protein
MFWALMHMMIFLLKHKSSALKHSYFRLLDLVERIIIVPQIELHKLHAMLMQDGTVTKENKKWKLNLRFLLLTQDDLSFLVSCVLPTLVAPCPPRGLSMLWDT